MKRGEGRADADGRRGLRRLNRLATNDKKDVWHCVFVVLMNHEDNELSTPLRTSENRIKATVLCRVSGVLYM